MPVMPSVTSLGAFVLRHHDCCLGVRRPPGWCVSSPIALPADLLTVRHAIRRTLASLPRDVARSAVAVFMQAGPNWRYPRQSWQRSRLRRGRSNAVVRAQAEVAARAVTIRLLSW